MLSKRELERYNRQLILPEVDIQGQQRLKQAKLLVVGAGGLGCPLLQYLVAAGVGGITIVDDDQVELSNLQRQVLYKVNHTGKSKVETAAKALFGINPEVRIDTERLKLTRENGQKLASQAEIIIDCSDNFATRFLLNEIAVKQNKLLIAGAVSGMKGQVWVFDQRCNTDSLANGFADSKACLNCLFPQQSNLPKYNCQTQGVLGVTLGVLGSLMASECIKYILELSEGCLFLSWDMLATKLERFVISNDPECTVCASNC